MFLIILIFSRFNVISFLQLNLSIIFIALFYGTIFSHLHRISPALSLVGTDEIYDGGHSIGFANWGINSNIFQTDSSFSYYKLSYLWLGPIFELTGSSVLLISSAVAVPLIFTVIGQPCGRSPLALQNLLMLLASHLSLYFCNIPC